MHGTYLLEKSMCRKLLKLLGQLCVKVNRWGNIWLQSVAKGGKVVKLNKRKGEILT
jgi:hypothetical protein